MKFESAVFQSLLANDLPCIGLEYIPSLDDLRPMVDLSGVK
jgi:hypothetical protein